MNKKSILIILSSAFVFLILLTVFVFKANGSNELNSIEGCVPYNVSISKDAQYSVVVNWSTEDNCLGYLSYGQDRDKLDSIAINREKLSAKNHSITVDKLLPTQNYYLIIHSGSKTYGNKGIPLSFSISSL